jgi:hypothetical protein
MRQTHCGGKAILNLTFFYMVKLRIGLKQAFMPTFSKRFTGRSCESQKRTSKNHLLAEACGIISYAIEVFRMSTLLAVSSISMQEMK